MFLGLQILIPVTFALFLKLKLEIFELVIVFICQDSRRCEEIYDKTSCLSYEIYPWSYIEWQFGFHRSSNVPVS